MIIYTLLFPYSQEFIKSAENNVKILKNNAFKCCKRIFWCYNIEWSFRYLVYPRTKLSSKECRFLKQVEIFTDGACSGNPGPGGWGAILRYKGTEKEISGGEANTTNNRMELMAVISALELLKEPCEVTLYSDSQYVCNALERGWAKNWQKNGWMRNRKEPALNPDLWERLLKLYDTHKVNIVWVRGHAGHPENERCDVLAVNESRKFM